MFKPWPWVALLIVIASLVGFHVYDKNVAVKAAIVTTTSTMNKEYQTKLDKSVKEATTVSDKLLADSTISEKAKDVKIQNLTNSLNSAISSLSKRPQRQPAQVNTNPPSIASSCTGAGLYREDGSFLAGEAARADKALIDRDFYYEQYEQARKNLESMNK